MSVVGLKVEIATDRHKTVLFDNTVAPLPCLGPGQRQEVVIRHDVKVKAKFLLLFEFLKFNKVTYPLKLMEFLFDLLRS